jgi:hypothetical protein
MFHLQTIQQILMKINTLHEYQNKFLKFSPRSWQDKGKVFYVLNLAPGLEDVWVMEVKLYTSLSSPLGGGAWSVTCHGSITPGEKAPLSIGRSLGGSHSWSGYCEEKHVCLCWKLNSDSPIIQPIA